MVESIGLKFSESYTAYLKNFEFLYSINGKKDTWFSAGIFTVKKGSKFQIFPLP